METKRKMTKSPVALAKMAPRIAKDFYPTSTICHPNLAAISKDRLSRYHPDVTGLLRPLQCPGTKKGTTLLNALLCRKEVAKKRGFESLLNGIFGQVNAIGLLDEHPQAAVDATVIESHHTSQYYVRHRTIGRHG